MHRRSLLGWFLAGSLAFTGVSCRNDKKTDPPANTDAKAAHDLQLGVLFNGWFGFDPITGKCVGGLGSTHWNDGPDTAGIVHTPIAAPGEKSPFYCSADPVRIRHQLDLMEDAGIGVLLYSWWGWGDSRLDGNVGGHPDKWMNQSITALLEELKRRKSPIKVAILIEPFTQTQGQLPPPEMKPHQWEMVLEYLQSNFYGPHPEQMFQYDGHPLLSTFDPMYMPRTAILKNVRVGTPEADDVIDWWPRHLETSLEIVSGDKLAFAAEAQHVRITVPPNTHAADLVVAVTRDPTIAPLIGATLLPGAKGAGVVQPLARRGLVGTGDIQWTVKWLSSKERMPQWEKDGWQWWLVPQQPPGTTLSNDGVVFLNHRFSEYYLHMARASYLKWQWRDLDPMLNQGFYEKQWQWALDNRDKLRIVFVYSWNFYGELAQLEPSEQGPAPPGREYLARTKRYFRQLKSGAKTLR